MLQQASCGIEMRHTVRCKDGECCEMHAVIACVSATGLYYAPLPLPCHMYQTITKDALDVKV